MRVVKVQIPNREKIEDVLSESDVFYGEIHIADDHILAWEKEYSNRTLKEISLIEEMAELTQAVSKFYRNVDTTTHKEYVDHIKEEMAHVLISLRGLAWELGILPKDIQAEIEKKWPAAYESKKGECKDCYWCGIHTTSSGEERLECYAKRNQDCKDVGPCEGFVKKEE